MIASTCDYGTLKGPCPEITQGGLCALHDQPRFTVCANCGGTAPRLCTIEISPGARCGKPLCPSCVHGKDGHQHVDEVPDVLRGSPQHPQAREQRQEVHDQLSRVVAMTLTRLQEQQALVLHPDADPERVADQFVRDLGVHALAGLLLGMARTR